jgi:hypothetical protein
MTPLRFVDRCKARGRLRPPFFILHRTIIPLAHSRITFAYNRPGCRRLDPALNGMVFAVLRANQCGLRVQRGVNANDLIFLDYGRGRKPRPLMLACFRRRVLTEATISPSAGGQNAVFGTVSSLGDLAPAGSYFIEIPGLSAGDFSRATDGNVTAISDPTPVGAAPVPEISTWAMIAVGFACMAFIGWRFQD